MSRFYLPTFSAGAKKAVLLIVECGECGRVIYLAKDRLIGIIAGHWIALGLSRGRDRAAAYGALRGQQLCELVSAAVRMIGSLIKRSECCSKVVRQAAVRNFMRLAPPILLIFCSSSRTCSVKNGPRRLDEEGVVVALGG